MNARKSDKITSLLEEKNYNLNMYDEESTNFGTL